MTWFIEYLLCVIWVSVLVNQADASTAATCSNLAEGSCEAQPIQSEKDKLYLAGFLPDGYFERAKGRLEDMKDYFDVEVKQFQSKKDYLHWCRPFLDNFHPHVGEHDKIRSASTLIWLEDPYELLGDSDELERFASTCTQSLTCHHPRDYARVRRDKIKAERERFAADGTITTNAEKHADPNAEWAHEAHQVVKCETTTGPFHMLLNRDWNEQAFLSFLETVTEAGVKNVAPLKHEGYFDVQMNRTLTLSSDTGVSIWDKGTISSNGEMLRINVVNKRKPIRPSASSSEPSLSNDGFVAIGFVPSGDLQRTVEKWSTTPDGDQIYTCARMTGGLKRVQNILAMDRLDKV